MQLYGHGIRRRVAPMLGGDRDRLRMAWSLMFSLAGTPVIFYGDEIGMGENLEIPDRYSVRVPMQLEQREQRLGEDGTLDVSLARYGYLWLRVRRDAARQLD